MTKRAASYSRVSTGQQEQDGTSLDTQAAAIATYVNAHGYSLATEHIYQDVHSGAQYRERPGLSQLRAAIRAGEIDILIFYAIDRLSRNQTHLAVLVDEAESHNVRLECVTEEWDDSAVGKAVRNLRAFVAETEREKIIERTVRGRMARVTERKLLLPGPKPPYGYVWADDRDHRGWQIKGRLVEDPNTAPIVRRIFNWSKGTYGKRRKWS